MILGSELIQLIGRKKAFREHKNAIYFPYCWSYVYLNIAYVSLETNPHKFPAMTTYVEPVAGSNTFKC